MKKIKVQLILLVVLMGIVVTSALTSTNIYFMNSLKKQVLKRSKIQMETAYDEDIKNVTRNTVGVLEYYNKLYENGDMTLKEAKKNAKELIRGIRYGKDDIGYFWIDDKDYKLVMHPLLSKGEGKYRGDLVDKTGKKIIQELINGSIENGSKYLDFYFPKPGENEATRKRGYAEYFEPWGWIIGTGNYIDDIELVIDEYDDFINSKINNILVMFGIIFIVITGLIIILGSFFSNKLAKGILEVKYAIEKIASNDLSGDKLEIKEKNELGQLKNFYNEMKEHLNDFVSITQESSNKIDKSMTELIETANRNKSTSEEIAYAVEEVTQTTVDQASNTEDTVLEINDLANDIDVLFKNSENLNDKIEGINKLNKKGVEKIDSLAQWSTKTLEGSKKVSSSIRNMDESSKMIEGVTDTISSIAEQTNLLALNASIEAARAGEAGKGFAVVADEIRKLAEETAKSTDEIKEKVGTILSATDIAVENMDNTESIVKKNSIVVEETETIFGEITTTIGNIVCIIDEIFSVVKGLESKKESILDNTNSISAASQEISASSEEVSASTEEQIAHMKNMLENINELRKISDILSSKTLEFKLK